MRKTTIILAIIILLSMNALAFNGSKEKFKYYRDLFKVSCANEKITDNRGNGFEPLYGTRNMRTILYGVAYRGGANNFYHKTNKRDNHNPLPEDGLENLAEQGFSAAVYLYGTNFSQAKKTYINKKKDTLRYIQNSGMSRSSQRQLMLMVQEVIKNPNKGPLYLHCWNGWHQSGYVSAIILMQFCKITKPQARQYWIDNTDGVNKGYSIVDKIADYEPFPDITIDESTRLEICPCMKK